MRHSKPIKNSKSKLNSTMTIYNKNPNFLPSTVSNRETHNFSQNNRINHKKKDLALAKHLIDRRKNYFDVRARFFYLILLCIFIF